MRSFWNANGSFFLGPRRGLISLTLLSTIVWLTAIARAQEDGARAAAIRVRTSAATGTARFVAPRNGEVLPVILPAGKLKPDIADILREYAPLFGVSDPARELVSVGAFTDELGQTHTSFRQVHEGVPVFGAFLRVHTTSRGEPRAVNGTIVPHIRVSTQPTIAAIVAARIARDHVAKQHPGGATLIAQAPTLYVYRLHLTRAIPGPNHLVYEVEVGDGAGIREFVYIDAHKGAIVDQIKGICDALDRRVYDGGFDGAFLVWSEGDAFPTGVAAVDDLIEYTEDAYNYFQSSVGYPSWDGLDSIMHAVNNDPTINCPNAHWTGFFIGFCPGTTSDDVVGHEWAHGYTQSTHDLIYQWQSGALNEAYSDIHGEAIDLLNGSGTDSPISLRSDGGCSLLASSSPPALTINAPPSIAGFYVSGGAAFNPAGPIVVTGDVELVNDGSGSTTDGCEALIGFTAGRIALIDRGTCAFTTKVANAAAAGAIGVIIANHESDDVFTMSGSPTQAIPAALIGLSDGDTLKAEVGVNATIEIAEQTDNSFRWLMGEDAGAFGSSIRDMWNPNCRGNPGRVSDPFYWCSEGDGGGVHTNSGIPNHAFALLVDGGTYNGHVVPAIGLTKALHMYWRAQAVYQGPPSSFADHADALEQSCVDLLGINLNAWNTNSPASVPSGEIISAADCAAVAKAIAATELRAESTPCNFQPLLAPDPPALCGAPDGPAGILFEDWEAGTLDGWTAGTHSVANPLTFDTPDWAVVGGLPGDRPGLAAFVADLIIGNCGADTEAGVLFLESPTVAIPPAASTPLLAFDHFVQTERGWDGGNLKISVNGGAWTPVPAAAFTFNPYNLTLNESDNPMGGEPAYSGADDGSFDGSWGQSQVDLSSLVAPGDNVKLRFEFGLDGCNGNLGWFVDEVRLYFCTAGCSDGDLDGYGSPGSEDCPNGPAEDCDDTDPDIHPGAVEVLCNGIDENCNGSADDDANDDFDSLSVCGGDCDDTNAQIGSCVLFADSAAPYCVIDVDDILYVLAGFADADPCVNFPDANLVPCGQPCPAGAVDVDDILAVLRAFADDFQCPHVCGGP